VAPAAEVFLIKNSWGWVLIKFSNLVVAAAMNGAFLCSGNNEI